mmetsp:Transcript_23665/g.52103  ORF Transcript_23665/g.52103 Transcript_23665/m.52103 type:complete len:148 (-) Transcript_23665:340-783(-)
MQVANLINSRALENLEVRGSDYPPPAEKLRMAQFVNYVQMAALATTFGGEFLFKTVLSMEIPDIVKSLSSNKVTSFMGVWFVGNVVASNLLSTGAFEIWKGKHLVWSTIKQGRMPSGDDIVREFQRLGVEFQAMQVQEKVHPNPNRR